jgi:hypothetical protein
MLDSQDNMNRILECMLKKIFCADFIRVGFGVVKYIYEYAIGSVGFYCHLNPSFGNQHKIIRIK